MPASTWPRSADLLLLDEDGLLLREQPADQDVAELVGGWRQGEQEELAIVAALRIAHDAVSEARTLAWSFVPGAPSRSRPPSQPR
jgi:hypothetical protein